jgi:DNA-binding IclR family transcriptional regulator
VESSTIVINTTRIDQDFLNRLSKLYKSGVSIKEISDRMGMDLQTTVRLLRLLGYNTGVLEETWLTN